MEADGLFLERCSLVVNGLNYYIATSIPSVRLSVRLVTRWYCN